MDHTEGAPRPSSRVARSHHPSVPENNPHR
jgi:hypothetical protein